MDEQKSRKMDKQADSHTFIFIILSTDFNYIFRGSTVGTPGSMMSPAWTMEGIAEKRSDSDRASIYSRSSGSASEYSVPRALDKHGQYNA